MMLARLILWAILVASAATPVASASEHYAISAVAVAATISRSGVTVSPDQIVLPADVVANTAAPILKVRSLEKLENNRLLARLECINSDECLPFIVDIHVPMGSDAQITAGTEAQSLRTTQPRNAAFAVRSGSPVTLMLEGEHVHIRLQAICLQGGAPGQMIRVTDTNHRLIYQAQVVDASVVKGKLK
jgi:hypothetical protein